MISNKRMVDEDPINDESPDLQTMCTDFLFIVNFTVCDLFGQIPRRAALGGSTKLQRLKDQKSNNRIEIQNQTIELKSKIKNQMIEWKLPALALSVATSIIIPIVS